MAAGIPIVPIVIRNAELVAARNSTVINPGTVDVAVFPPISVQDWTLDTLPERIAEVRQLYLDTLANWPVGELPEVDLYAEKKAAQKARSRAAKSPATSPAKTPAKKSAAKKTAATSAAKTRAKKTAAEPKSRTTPAAPNPEAAASHNGEVSPSRATDPIGADPPEAPPRGRP